MQRQEILNLLEKYQPNEQEFEFKHRMIDFIKNNSNCFDRSLEDGHITASSWLVNKENDKALLLHHAKLNIWVQPGGHCDGDHDILQVALKEAREESGINNIKALSDQIFDIDIHLIPESKKEKAHFHYDIRFLLQVIGDEQVALNEESKNFIWIDKNNYPNIDTSVHRMIKKWQKL